MTEADWKRYKERTFNNLDKHIGLFSPDMLQRLKDHMDYMSASDLRQIEDFVRRSDELRNEQWDEMEAAMDERHAELRRIAQRNTARLNTRRSPRRSGGFTTNKTQERRTSTKSESSSLPGRITNMGLNDTSRYHPELFEDEDLATQSDEDFIDRDYNDDEVDTPSRAEIEGLINDSIGPLKNKLNDILEAIGVNNNNIAALKRSHGGSPTSPGTAHRDKDSRTTVPETIASSSTAPPPIQTTRKSNRTTTKPPKQKPVSKKAKKPLLYDTDDAIDEDAFEGTNEEDTEEVTEEVTEVVEADAAAIE